MIVVDIETSGLDFNKCGIWQIGALDLDNPGNTFLEESRIDEEDIIQDKALEIIGKIEGELRDKGKQSQKQLLENFFKWCESVKIKNCICENPQFDLGFIWVKARKFNLDNPIPYRAYDLHSIASLKYLQLNSKFLINEDHSDMGLTNTLNFCGIPDNRKEHNALEDCKLTAECFFRIVYGKGCLEEYEGFEIPEYLK